MPMVWYVPPLSPVVDLLRDQGHDAEDRGDLFGAIEALRIPVEYLAELFTAGDTEIVTDGAAQARRDALLHARHHPGPRRATSRSRRPSGMTEEALYEMYRLHGDREVRRPLRHPQGPRRAGPRPRGDGLLARLRRGARMYESGTVRRGERAARRPSRSRPSTRSSSGRPPSGIDADASRLRGRVNLLNWDGNGAPAGCSPAVPRRERRPSRGARGRESRRPGRAPGRVAGASTTPTPSCSSGCPLLRRGRRRRCRAGSARPSTALLDHLASDAARPPAADYVEVFDLDREARALPVLLDRRRHPAPRRGARPRSRRATAPAAGSSTPTVSCPTTCRWCWSSPRSPTRSTDRRCCRSTGPASSCCEFALQDDADARTPGSLEAVCATLPGASPADRAAVHRMAAAGPAAARPSGSTPYDPRLLPLRPRGPRDERAAVGRPAVRRARRARSAAPIWRYRYDQFGWTTRSSQLYESRLLRIGSPLFHFGLAVRPRRPRRRPRDPESWTEAVGVSQDSTTSTRSLVGGIAGFCTLVGIASCLPPAHHRAGVHGDHEERQADVRRARRRDRARPGRTTLVSVGAGRRGAQLPRDRRRPGSARCSCCSPTSQAMAAAPLDVPDPRPGRDAAVRHLAVHPAGARLHRAAALPVPALHRLPQPRRPPRPGHRATAPRLGRRSAPATATADRTTRRGRPAVASH